jgi:hypothetical protein
MEGEGVDPKEGERRGGWEEDGGWEEGYVLWVPPTIKSCIHDLILEEHL